MTKLWLIIIGLILAACTPETYTETWCRTEGGLCMTVTFTMDRRALITINDNHGGHWELIKDGGL